MFDGLFNYDNVYAREIARAEWLKGLWLGITFGFVLGLIVGIFL